MNTLFCGDVDVDLTYKIIYVIIRPSIPGETTLQLRLSQRSVKLINTFACIGDGMQRLLFNDTYAG